MKDDLQKKSSESYQNINSFPRLTNKPGLKSNPAQPDIQRPVQKKEDELKESEKSEKTAQKKEHSFTSPNDTDLQSNLPPLLSISPVQKKEIEEFEKANLEPWSPSMIQKKEAENTATQNSNSGGNKMPEKTQAKMETAFNTSFDNVNIYQDDKPSAINALAYTQGNNIHFAPGQYNPESQQGQELLGHELTHVVQQREGRVQATTQAKGLSINDDKGLEKEADDMGKKAAQLKAINNSDNSQNSKSNTSDIVQCVQESTTEYKSYDQLTAMTVFQLEKYANEQADWHSSPQLNDNMRYWIRSILAYVREGNRLAACGKLQVKYFKDKLIANGETDVYEHLNHYCDAVAISAPFELAATNSVTKAYAKGKNLKKLKAAFPAFVLKSAFKEWIFNWMVDNVPSWIDDLITYYTTTTPTPVFQAENGNDLDSFTEMKYTDGVDPITFAGAPLAGNIRNYHRFHKTALKKLQKNFNDTSKTKPLTLILHSGLDHNGAFHRDQNLTDVITNPNIHTLMIEGKETLDEVKSQIGPLAKKYGMNDKIDQVMFAGHGNARTIQLAGTIEDKNGEVSEKNDSINLNNNKTKSDEIFDEVFSNMDNKGDSNMQQRRNIIFNACLTNSNTVGFKTGEGETDATKIKDLFQKELQANLSLASYLQEKANNKSKDLTVKGSNASFGQIKLINSTNGELDLVSSKDPKLTAPKIEYVEFGTEPVGALRAVVECWISDDKTCFDAMTRRSAKTAKSWDEVIIKTCYDIILSKYKTDGVNINKLGYYSFIFSHASIEHYAKPSYLEVLDDKGADIITVLNALSSSDDWKNTHYIPLVVYQNLMTHNPGDDSLKDKFLAHLEAHFTCHSARKFVEIEYLDKKGHLKTLMAKADSKGKLMLGLLGVIGKTVNTECKNYILTKVNTANEFDTSLKINELLAGASSENNVLINIGKKSAPVQNPSANVKAIGDTNNKVYVKSLTKKGTVNKDPEAATYTLPDKTSKALNSISKNTSVNIIGEIDTWYGIEYKSGSTNGTAFIEKTDVAI